MIVSVSGPSKTGKTVLIKKVISEDDLIQLSGASISTAEILWERVLAWMDSPMSITSSASLNFSGTLNGKTSGRVGLPLVAEGSAEMSAGGSLGTVRQTAETRNVVAIDQVVKEIGGSSFVIFIDDFHYIPKELQSQIARQLKEAAEKGVRICTASVPHRSDDVVRGNPELRGRVQAIDFEFWHEREIYEIGRAGFAALHMVVSEPTIQALAEEAFGSPQLMQSMCLQACYLLGVEKTLSAAAHIGIDDEQIRKVLKHTSTTADFSSMLDSLHSGPKLRGQERKQFEFTDGSTGDVYRCVLLTLATNPPALSFSYDDILNRAKSVCTAGSPVGSSISEALKQMEILADIVQPGAKVVEWTEDVFDVSDPYFLFYLRKSDRLSKLQSPGHR